VLNFRDEESFIYTKGIKVLAFVALISLILAYVFDDKFIILEEIFRLTAIICQAMVLILLGTKALIIEKKLVSALACYIFVIIILGWIIYIKLIL